MNRPMEPGGNGLGLSLPWLPLRRARKSSERAVGRGPCARGGERHLIFSFAVRRLKWLARIPGAPQIFDAALLATTGLFNPQRLRAMSAIETTVRKWPEI